MTCREFQHWVSRSLDQTLDEPQERALDQHLASCDACRAEREAQRRLQRLLRSIPSPEIQDSVLPALRGRLNPGEARRIWWEDMERFARRLVPAAAVLLVVLAGFAVRGALRRSQPVPELESLLASTSSAVTEQETDVWGLGGDDELDSDMER
jgi:anti-sigma factor RsiW